MPSRHVLITLLALASCTVADPTDWINIDYVCNQSPSSSTKDAQNAIIQGARSTAAKGPWSVTNSKGVVAPSNDTHDYLSWAPYHWPNCNWCTASNGRVHLVHDGNRTDDDNGSSADDNDDANFQDEAVRNLDKTSELHGARRRMSRRRRRTDDANESSVSVAAVDVRGPQAPLGALPSAVPSSSLHLTTSPTTTTAVAGKSAPPQAAAKCTPSPTKPMPASATWTTCPYVVRDGKVNPDVRTLNGPAAINGASQSILFNAMAGVLQKNSEPTAYFKNVAGFINAFFIAASTAMSPNMAFGQVVRGPGPDGKKGTFTGILDLRGIVKICNAICILKAVGSPQWTKHIDEAMDDWMRRYLSWLTTSDLGKSTADKANNHRTFYAAQVTAGKILMGDQDGAIQALDDFFQDAYLEQIAASGEQPLEAVRTRPYHYRCFNLEALITLAKMGDQLGVDFWTAKSKYGATIKDAVDYLIKQDPKTEDVTEAVPHVAAVAAVYGDPDGKYAAFLGSTMSDYKTQPFWYYDQPGAFTQAPGAQRHKRDTDVASAVPFDCPFDDVLPNGERGAELDNDIYASCVQLKPLYEGQTPVNNNPVVAGL
ncbi:alginate lyase-domain-containing protein [Mycena capillaripes]|nr:alginate lyase-domain-containing protein [Mycena capillaripes]